MKFFNSVNGKNLNCTLRNFLAIIINDTDRYCNMLADHYSKSEKLEFLYNCAMNTIDEFLNSPYIFSNTKYATSRIQELFEKENIPLEQFDKRDYDFQVSNTTLNIIKKFECIKIENSKEQKNNILEEVTLLASTTI